MEFNKVQNKIKGFQKGSFHSVVWERPLEVKKAFKGQVVVKRTFGSGLRFGVNYDNMAAVQKKREDGTLPTENAGLLGRSWIEPNLFLESTKTGKKLVRVSLSQSSKMETQFFLNGVPVEKEQVVHMLYAKDAKPHNMAVDCFDVSTDAIIAID